MAVRRLAALLRKVVAWWNQFVAMRRVASRWPAVLPGAQLAGADLRDADLMNADLHDADLKGADLGGADLVCADLRGANLTKARLIGADLREADLRGANLTKAQLIGADLREADLAGARLGLANLTDADLRGVDLRGVDLMGADLRGANLSCAILTDADFRGVNLPRAGLSGADFTGADLSGVNLTRANLANAKLINTKLVGAKLNRADLQGAYIQGADLTEANLTSIFDSGAAGATGSFLDLASCPGLTKTNGFDIAGYLERAFDFAHRSDTRDVARWPNFVGESLEKITALRSLQAEAESPRLLIQAINTLTAQLIGYLTKQPKLLYGIPPRVFEEIIAEVLAGYGWKVDLTPKSGDGGYDIFALSPDKAGVETSWIIECKRYAPDRPIGVDIVRALYGANELNRGSEAAGMKMLATTSHFTAGAKAFKASRYDLALKDYESILDWLNTYRPNPNGRLYLDSGGRLVVPGQDE